MGKVRAIQRRRLIYHDLTEKQDMTARELLEEAMKLIDQGQLRTAWQVVQRAAWKLDLLAKGAQQEAVRSSQEGAVAGYSQDLAVLGGEAA